MNDPNGNKHGFAPSSSGMTDRQWVLFGAFTAAREAMQTRVLTKVWLFDKWYPAPAPACGFEVAGNLVFWQSDVLPARIA